MKISVKIRGLSQGTFQIKMEFGQSGKRGFCQRIQSSLPNYNIHFHTHKKKKERKEKRTQNQSFSLHIHHL